MRHHPDRSFSEALRWPGQAVRLALVPSTGSVIAVLLLVVSAPAFAQFDDVSRTVNRRGTTAAEFLTIPVGARETGMGGAVTAVVDNGTSIYWNPAGLAALSAPSLTAEQADWLAGIDFNYFSVVIPTGSGVIGFAISGMRTEEMDVTTVEMQNGTGEQFTASSYAYHLSYGRSLTDRFSFGATAKVINEKIWNSGATGVGFDVGTMFVTPFSGIRLGAAIANFGTKMQMAGDELLIVVDIDPNAGGNNESNRAYLKTDDFDLPLTMRIGLSGEVMRSNDSRLTLAVDALNPNNSEQFVNVGAELALLGELVQLRGGYSELFLDEALRSFTLGAGLRYGFGNLNFAFDYAYEEQEFFDGVNRFSLAIGL